MKTKKLTFYFAPFLFTITIFTIFCGCQRNNSSDGQSAVRPLEMGVQWYEREKADIIWVDNGQRYTYPIQPDVFFEDSKLQTSIENIIIPYPLDSDERISAYGWTILDILIDYGYLQPQWIPAGGAHYANGIVCIYYMEESSINTAIRDGALDVYISESDGHIVFIDPT